MLLEVILKTVVPVFLIIATGYIIGKKKKLNVQILIDLIVYIAGPALIVSSIARSDISLEDFGIIAGASLAIIFAMVFLTYIILKKSNRKCLYLPMVFGNTGYLGYPVALFAFGVAGLSRAVVFDMMNSLVIFSLGVYLINKRNQFKEIFKVPLIYAVVLGLIFNLFKIPIPDVIFNPIEMIGLITIPLALLVLGYQLTEIRINSARTAVLASLFKIIGGFLVALLIIKLFSIEGLAKNIILLQAAMPSAVMTMILSAKYKRDAACVASIVLITTVFSLITIPLILWFLP
ncbi:MAG: AEC family transporter [Nanoarchaeota archaeon]|nr:AEC family transporter [Nanoarchaeota archaeon]